MNLFASITYINMLAYKVTSCKVKNCDFCSIIRSDLNFASARKNIIAKCKCKN